MVLWGLQLVAGLEPTHLGMFLFGPLHTINRDSTARFAPKRAKDLNIAVKLRTSNFAPGSSWFCWIDVVWESNSNSCLWVAAETSISK